MSQYPYGGQQPQYPAPPRKAVTKSRKSTSRGFHLVMTICTAGACACGGR